MLEQIIYNITSRLLADSDAEVDKEPLEQFYGSFELADEIVNGIRRAIKEAEGDDYQALKDYNG